MMAYCSGCGATIWVGWGKPKLCPDCVSKAEPKPEEPAEIATPAEEQADAS